MTPSSRQTQSGVSLIGLMVGLILSMLVVLAMLSVYRISVRVSVDATQSAQLTGQLSTGLLGAQMRLQGAGFRVVDPGYSTSLLVLAEATLNDEVLSGTQQDTLPARGNAVIWREGERCSGLLAEGANLFFLASNESCTNTSAAIDTLTWTSASRLVGEAGGDNRTTIEVIANEGECRPFGVTESSGRFSVTLNVRYLTRDGDFDNARPSVPATVCLPNFPPATSST